MNTLLSALCTIILFMTLFVECGSINQPEPAEPPAIPTATGLPAEPEEIDQDLPHSYPEPAENQQEIEAESYPAPTLQSTPDAYPPQPSLPTPYPDPDT